MLKAVFKVIGSNYNRTHNIVSKLLSAVHDNPFFYFKEFLNISKSLITSFLLRSNKSRTIIRKINGVKFLFDFDLFHATPTYFLGTNQISITKTLIKFLKKGDIFIDVGANIGYFSAVGAGLVGKKGEVHCFEPVPHFFKRLVILPKINDDYKIFLNYFALGEIPGVYELEMTPSDSSLVPNYVHPKFSKGKFNGEVRRLDEYLFERNIENIALIKIDVEGYEFPVLKGLSRYFEQKKDNLPPIVVEIIPRAYPLLGIELEDLENYMKKFSYYSYTLDGKHRIDFTKFTEIKDVLFIQK